jgi:hypothetical protein
MVILRSRRLRILGEHMETILKHMIPLTTLREELLIQWQHLNWKTCPISTPFQIMGMDKNWLAWLISSYTLHHSRLHLKLHSVATPEVDLVKEAYRRIGLGRRRLIEADHSPTSGVRRKPTLTMVTGMDMHRPCLLCSINTKIMVRVVTVDSSGHLSLISLDLEDNLRFTHQVIILHLTLGHQGHRIAMVSRTPIFDLAVKQIRL